ncbi:hypothetical protein [Deinococcus cellulosilyticus]|uniref:Uncharacterized protein n=1 Tax=Deinococcus cellulosilyticus (strain DSM 18568 / NBRC 106333 / KACC 11606 / 5516J-15) TaxID=1223518 RepID=A0A511NCA6_DEIC1|nr:hypothetical protein [Deinococcus cellulosilyticus]GEM49981.1 hypothetical protein DC3_56160 [Deinococcus cellulosilyticus NBRC 106333 = KACC 11606]
MNFYLRNRKRTPVTSDTTRRSLGLTFALLYLIQQFLPMAAAAPSLYARPGAGVSDLPIEVLAFNTPGFGEVSDAINLATGNVYVDTGSLGRNNILDPSKDKDEKKQHTLAGSNWNLQSKLRLAGYNGIPGSTQLKGPWFIYSGDGSGTRYNLKSNLNLTDPNLPSWLQRYASKTVFKVTPATGSTPESTNYTDAQVAIYASESTPGIQVPEQYLVFVKTWIASRSTHEWVAHLYDHSGNRSTFFEDGEHVDFKQNLSQQYRSALNNDPEGIGASPKTQIEYNKDVNLNTPGLISKVKDEWGRVTTFVWKRYQNLSTQPPVLLAINELLQDPSDANSWTRQTRFAYDIPGAVSSLVVKQVMYIAQNGRENPDPAVVNSTCGNPTDSTYNFRDPCTTDTFENGTSTAGGYMARTFNFAYKVAQGHVLLTELKKPILRTTGSAATSSLTYTYTYNESSNPPQSQGVYQQRWRKPDLHLPGCQWHPTHGCCTHPHHRLRD